MNVLELYADVSKHGQLAEIFSVAAQQQKSGLPANFLEKDLWVTEILRLLYDEQLLGLHSVAFKGGTALSKCWGVIERFSEDIDLSIHWAELSDISEVEELAAWQASTKNNSQIKKFKENQQKRLLSWSEAFIQRLNEKFASYRIDGLRAELEPNSSGEKIDIHFPRVTRGKNDYQLDHILLEFGGRNRGKPTAEIEINSYLSDIKGFESLGLPKAKVMAYQQDFILWEKITALHQLSTQTKEPNPDRLARHWYDVDCLINTSFADPFTTSEAMLAVIEMKRFRWSEKGVDYDLVANGGLRIIPKIDRLARITQDHKKAIEGGMFFSTPDSFDEIINRLEKLQDNINQAFR